MLRHESESSRPGLGRKKSECDFKPFSIFKHFLLGFAGCSFFEKLPPEGQLNHETYVPKLIKNQTSGVVYHITI